MISLDVFIKTIISRNLSENADCFKNILLELRATARKARTASASDTMPLPSIHEGEKPMVVSPSRLPFFLAQTVGPRSHQRWGRLRAAGQIPALSASMACFICPGLFWAARWARFGAWAAERRDKNAYSIKHASFINCRSVAHAPNLT